ncbi:unnamed protein product [Gordionus sp. m RMFG-2023]
MILLTPFGILGNILILYALSPLTKGSCGNTLKASYSVHNRHYLVWIHVISLLVCIITGVRGYWIIKYPEICLNNEMSLFEVLSKAKFRHVLLCNLLFLSHWFMGVLSIRGFIAIKFPIFYKIKFINKESNLDSFIMLFLTVVSFITSLPFLFNKSIYLVKTGQHVLENKYFIQTNEKMKPFFSKFYTFAATMAITIPCILIVIFNLQTWYLIYKKDKSKESKVMAITRGCSNTILNSNLSLDQVERNSVIKLHNFAVMASVLSTITFFFSIPAIILSSLESEFKLFELSCHSDYLMLVYIFVILKHFMYPYLIVLGNPMLRKLMSEKIKKLFCIVKTFHTRT